MLKASFFLKDQVVFENPGRPIGPRVSVILPTYCRGDNGMLAQSIDSVLAQRFSDFELLVIDDGSVDGTADLLQSYVAQDPRVVHVRHDRNSGLPALRVNEGLMLARGEFCAYQFDDDTWTIDALSSLVDALDRNPDVGLVYGVAIWKLKSDEVRLGSPFSYAQLEEGNCIANNAVLHRRRLFTEFGGYDMHLAMRRICDWDLWLRWSRRVRFLHVDTVVSVVNAWQEESLGRTVDYDTLVPRFMSWRPRDAMLTPERLADYEVDALEPLRSLGPRVVDDIWRMYVAPYVARRKDIELVPQERDMPPRYVIVTKEQYDPTVDITIRNIARCLEGRFDFSFIPTAQLDRRAIDACDAVIFHRAMTAPAPELMAYAKERGKACLYLMDDDLLHFHELGQAFAYIAPGATSHEIIKELIASADISLTYSPLITESARRYSGRVIELSTNIRNMWLDRPARALKRPDAPIKIGFAGGGAREEEFAALWPALERISERYGERIEFHFWGLRPEGIDTLSSPIHFEPFTVSYDEYMARLVDANFDIMLAPLFAAKRAKRAKCPIKFLEITAAQAVGIYSDVEPYAVVESGRTGYKCENTVDAWVEMITAAIEIGAEARINMVNVARTVVTQRFTSEVQAEVFGSALDASICHAALRAGGGGAPRIAYVFHSPYLGGAENHLLRHAGIAAGYGFEPIVVLPAHARQTEHEVHRYARDHGFDIAFLPFHCETEPGVRAIDPALASVAECWLIENKIVLLHSVTLIQEVAVAARAVGVPHVASLYAVENESPVPVLRDHCDAIHSDSFLYANKWARLLDSPARCIRSHVPQMFFAEGRSKLQEIGHVKTWRVGIFGTLQARKGQLQAVHAVARLRTAGVDVDLDLYGYTQFYEDYVDECRQVANEYGVSEHVRFHGFREDVASEFLNLDILLCASDWESLPQVILEAMAAGVLVVAPAVGGIPEVVSNLTGVLLRDNSIDEVTRGLQIACSMSDAERAARIALALQVVLAECSGTAVSSALFELYTVAARERTRTEGPAGRSNAYDTAQISRLKAELSRVTALLEIENARHHAVMIAKGVKTAAT
ncbi:glycosyltransferase [Burkholderia vietnamiensis]|uniref:glycosyltransferase n=1 Tax=Burkholderia vietnamiensis TaxID=60552 RepID=UPI00158C66A3|nr:glycosyltransferase [Burkholderia vietnamiensis]MBR8007563.1 glycosyltransferase [Burkholderia vietnamiensis]MDN7669716.1 glycosyltransferase [Burkholderia vietnamiensis]HDR8954515.1 glycosyltransferase [Burkholderia vietnamiensis]